MNSQPPFRAAGRWPLGLALTILLGVVGASLAAARSSVGSSAERDERPCQADSRHDQLDFWLGEWRVLDEEGVEVAMSRVEKLHGDCLIEESWTDRDGSSGQGMSYFDPSVGRWRQDRVDGNGRVLHYEGELREGSMYFEGRHIRHDGTITLARVLLATLPRGRVRQRIEHSGDAGETWSTVLDATYVSVNEPQPAELSPLETKKRSAQSVKAVSETVPIAPGQEAQTHMASPMTLEVTLGPLQFYPQGTAWTSDETAAYICNGLTILKVQAERREKKGRLELHLAFNLHTQKGSRRAELSVELRAEGKLISSQVLENIRVGRRLLNYDAREGLRKSTTFRLAPELFEELFRDGKRPKLRLTLKVM